MSVLPRLVDSKSILRGKVKDVALPFIQGRPLNFVIEDTDNPNLYKIIEKDDGFEGFINPINNKKKSEIVKVVTEFKLRPCLIIQKDEYNLIEDYPFTVILPLANISKEQRKRKTFQRVINYNDIDQYYYLGHNSYVTINDPHKVYKNMLFERDNEVSIDKESCNEIMMRLAQCFKINTIKECDTCSRNCNNCEFKNAVNK
jgi:hypothetical protein